MGAAQAPEGFRISCKVDRVPSSGSVEPTMSMPAWVPVCDGLEHNAFVHTNACEVSECAANGLHPVPHSKPSYTFRADHYGASNPIPVVDAKGFRHDVCGHLDSSFLERWFRSILDIPSKTHVRLEARFRDDEPPAPISANSSRHVLGGFVVCAGRVASLCRDGAGLAGHVCAAVLGAIKVRRAQTSRPRSGDLHRSIPRTSREVREGPGIARPVNARPRG